MKKLFLASCLGALSFVGALPGADIVWEEPQTITGETDVSLEGDLVYAWHTFYRTWATARTVNGVRFKTRPYNNLQDVCSYGCEVEVPDGYYGWNVNWGECLSGLNSNYTSTLSGVVWSKSAGAPMTMRFKDLTPGRRYAVQIWFNTTGFEPYRDCVETLSGKTPVTLRGSTGETGPGQHVRGLFTATDTFQDITITPENTTLSWIYKEDQRTEKMRAVVNSFQLRVLDSEPIAWEAPQNIVDANDVRTEGSLIVAFGHSMTNYTINGVTFISDGNTYAYPPRPHSYLDRELFSSVSFAYSSARYGAFFDKNDSATSDYFKMLNGGLYKDGTEARTMTLRGLVPGHTYLVQFWVNDARYNDASGSWPIWKCRTISIGGSQPLYYGGKTDGKYGQYVVGRFTADRDTYQLALVPGLDYEGSTSIKPSVQWNAFQLRDVTPGQIDWEEPRALTGEPEADVDQQGHVVYAWHCGTSDVTYGGTAFRARFIPPIIAGDDPRRHRVPESRFDMGVSDFYRNIQTGFTTNLTGESAFPYATELHKLLDSRAWCGIGYPFGVTLRRLVPGHRYRVQFFWADTKSGDVPQDYCLDGLVRVRYGGDGGEGAGRSVTGEFTATDTERAIRLTSFTQNPSLCLQAVQLRALDPTAVPGQRNDGQIVQGIDQRDVATEGAGLAAISAGAVELTNTWGNIIVPFAPAGSSKNYWTNDYFALPKGFKFDNRVTEAYIGGKEAYRFLVGGGYYRDKAPLPLILTVSNLVRGCNYRLQLWQCDERPDYAYRTSYIGSYGGGKLSGIFGRGWFALIDFTATGMTWPLAIANTNFQINAVQLRKLGESILPIWSGTKTIAEDTTVTGDVIADGPLVLTGSGALNLVSGAFRGGDCTIQAPWAGTTLARVLEGRTTLAVTPDKAQEIVTSRGGIVQIASGVSVEAALIGGSGTLAGPGAVTYNLPGASAFAGRLTEGVKVRKTGTGAWRLSGEQAGQATVEVPEGRLAIASGTFAGDFTLAAANPVQVSGVTFAPGAALRLAGGTGLAIAGEADLAGLTLHVEAPTQHRPSSSNPILVYGEKATGTPEIVLAARGFVLVSSPQEDGTTAVYAQPHRGMAVSIR